MAISTVGADGSPQTTLVGYANEGWVIYFVIFRASQKFANIQRDNRVSVVVGLDPPDLQSAKAVYAGATAAEVTEPRESTRAWELLRQRHPNLHQTLMPPHEEAALMRADCKYVSVLDYGKGIGHSETLVIA